jgi:uncharacterized protein (DUF58 family)
MRLPSLRLWPAGVPRRSLILLGLVAAFHFVARASGAGWVVVLICIEAPLVLIAAIWPAITLLRVQVTVLGNQRDATAGSATTFRLGVARAGSGIRLCLRIGDRASGWVAALGASEGDMIATPPARGIVTTIAARVEGSGPLGLMTWVRHMDLALPSPMEVGPRPTVVSSAELAGLSLDGDEVLTGGAGHDMVRGVRPYVSGDPIRVVHWPATARWGEVMVKEMEGNGAPAVVIVVDLRGDPDRAEEAASAAAGLANAGLRSGLSVSLLTAEGNGPCAGPVTSPTLVGRRLARAVTDAGPPAPPGLATIVRVTAT